MSWNRKYRPQKVAELHQNTVREQIQHLMNEGRIPQVMLFAGPKGTGKTSTARILGALLNDPVNKSAVETVFFGQTKSKNLKFEDVTTTSLAIKNIISGNSFIVNEMDAASNRGIDDVRFLKDRVSLSPQDGLIAVYILDEAHMLTTEAFNALLKLLEEPPKHVLFILATTELHKIPPTIVSRSQLINFKKATSDELKSSLEKIIKAEKLSVDPEALEVIVDSSDGSFRDAIKMMELIVKDGKISVDQLSVSNANLDSKVESLIKNITDKNSSAVVKQFDNFRQEELDPIFLHKRLLELLHSSLMSSFKLSSGVELVSKEVAQFLLVHLSDPSLSAYNPLPHLPLELKILSIVDKAQKNNKPKTSKPKTISEAVVTPKKVMTEIRPLNPDLHGKPGENWSEFIESVKSISTQAGLLLQSTKCLSSTNGKVDVAVYYKFHQQQLQSDSIKKLLEEIAQNFFGYPYEFSFEFQEKQSEGDLDPKLAVVALM